MYIISICVEDNVHKIITQFCKAGVPIEKILVYPDSMRGDTLFAQCDEQQLKKILKITKGAIDCKPINYQKIQ